VAPGPTGSPGYHLPVGPGAPPLVPASPRTLGVAGQPNTTMSLRLASCSCGKLSAQVQGDPIRVSVCHCLACQRRTGSVFGAQARFAAENMTIKGQGTEFLRIGDEGSRIIFTFCPDCGATVFYRMEGREVSCRPDFVFRGSMVSIET